MNENIYKALAAAYAETKGIAKDREMQSGQRYSYASIDAVIEHVRPVMSKHGLMLYPSDYSYEADTYQTSNGATMNHVICKAQFTLAHESGEYVEVRTIGEGADIGDKACNKAMTSAHKYALRQLFCLSTDEDDPDHTPSATQQRQAPAQRSPLAQQAQRISEEGYEAAEQFTPDLQAWRDGADWKIDCPTHGKSFAKEWDKGASLKCNRKDQKTGEYCTFRVPFPAA